MSITTKIEQCVFTADDGRPRYYKANPDLSVRLIRGGLDDLRSDGTTAKHVLVSMDIDDEPYDVIQVEAFMGAELEAVERAISALQVVAAGLRAAGGVQ